MRPLFDSYVLETTRATRDTYSNTRLNHNAYNGSNLMTASALDKGNIKCNSGSTVAEATRLIVVVSSISLDGGVCFPSEFITTDTFALG